MIAYFKHLADLSTTTELIFVVVFFFLFAYYFLVGLLTPGGTPVAMLAVGFSLTIGVLFIDILEQRVPVETPGSEPVEFEVSYNQLIHKIDL